MHISVNILSGGEPKREVIPLEVIPDDRVENVKAKIEQIVQSLPSYQQLLLYSGQQLEDGSSLEEYGVEDNSTILLVFKPNGKEVSNQLP